MSQEMQVPKLGQVIEGEAFRDAVHVAVAPVEAGEDMMPGEHTGPVEHGSLVMGACRMGAYKYAIGVVDPFLKHMVRKGQRFWLFLYPNTVTSLRHAWTHPAFAIRVPAYGKENADE